MGGRVLVTGANGFVGGHLCPHLATHDYEVNVKAEMEIIALHTKMDELRQNQWDELIRLQRAQLELLQELRNAAKGS